VLTFSGPRKDYFLVTPPPSPWSIGIIELARNARKILELEQL
jgi:hypothetical protein